MNRTIPNESKLRRNVWSKRAPGLLLLGIASYLFLRSQVYRAPKVVDTGKLHLIDLTGTPVPPAVTSGKPVVLNFWAPWCPPCRIEIPWLEHLQHDNPGVAVIGVENDPDSLDQARTMAREQRISYTLAVRNSSIDQTFGTFAGLPTTLYISSSGKVIHTVTGMVPERVMQRYVRDAIAAH